MEQLITGIYAGIVLYFPNEEHTVRQLEIISAQVDKILIFLNYHPNSAFRKKIEAEVSNIEFLNTGGTNLGLGKAYNMFIEKARLDNCTGLVLFDQDSLPLTDTIRKLQSAMAGLENEGFDPILVGPLPVSYGGDQLSTAAPTGRNTSTGCFEVEFAISSGSFIDLAKVEAVGLFREDFFIDCIDIEWCYRARYLGYSIWICPNTRMLHALGNGVFMFLGITLTDQSPKRFYTFLRNQIVLLKLEHVPLIAKIKSTTSMPIRIAAYLYKERSYAIMQAIIFGLWHGFLDKLGRPRDF